MDSSNKRATWIWYPGDFEIWLGNRFNNRRTERGSMFPPFWKQDSHWATVEFSKEITLTAPEVLHVSAEGQYNFMVDGKLLFAMPQTVSLPAGKHRLNVKVYNLSSPPALFIEGTTVHTDESWLVTYEDKSWIDENGVAHGCGVYKYAACWNFNSADTPPSAFHLERRRQAPQQVTNIGAGRLIDFGKETMGYLLLNEISGTGHIYIYYGESAEEALDKERCETLDQIRLMESHVVDLSRNTATPRWNNYRLQESKAFRYVYMETDEEVGVGNVAMDYEYLPYDEQRSGSFCCDDEELNRIWATSAYTMDLTTREFFLDGIKRDRWTWSGDAIQSYLMNYYLRFNTEAVKRTIRQLRGKDPVTAHVNTIMDYSFFWFKSVLDYYQYTADIAFVREIYPRMRTLMDYCLQRTNADGMAEGQADDWIFVDWVDFPMHKRGTLCFEQILFCKSLETMQHCATICHDHPLFNPPQGSITAEAYEADAKRYGQLAETLRAKLKPTFWSQSQHAFMHAIEDGKMNAMITKFPNMFAIIYGYANAADQQEILHHVLLNPAIEAITTPYMRFYELESLCALGQQPTVLSEMKAYWGGMLREGATTFWEKYIPSEHGRQHLAMYGRPYGKSLCHAWGASPIYLLGKYFLGVSPTAAGYAEYEVRPTLGGLRWMEGDVPTPFGKIHVRMDENCVSVKSDGGLGRLYFQDQCVEIPPKKEIIIKR